MTDSPTESRRGFLGLGAAAGAAAGAGLLTGVDALLSAAEAAPANRVKPTPRDIAVLRFLAAAELVEADLWGQYAELAQANRAFKDALDQIDDGLFQYAIDTAEDELSHAEFINAYLKSVGAEPVNLDGFRTIMPPRVQGLKPRGRLTNLTDLNVDTSWYARYQSDKNPDFGASFPQIATIRRQSAIPTSDRLKKGELAAIAQVAAFHFASIEQGGTSLYCQFTPFVTAVDVMRITSSIYATEAIHYAVFRQSLEGVMGVSRADGKLAIPDLRGGKRGSFRVMPLRTRFLDPKFPTCSVIRPSLTANAGAVAAATGLVHSNLFKGQSATFLNAVVALAKAADGVA
jgi:hypothetical protein